VDIYDTQEFGLSLVAYMNYVQRKLKRDSSFDPHPLVKALNCAFEGIEKLKVGETFMGVSGDANRYPDNSPRESYCVVIRKENNGFTLLKVHDLTMGRDVPLGAAIYLILISMKMDKFDGPNIPVDDAISIINETLPEVNIVRFNNSEWKEARDNFRKTLQEGKLRIPEHMFTEELRRDILNITYSTPWEEYPPSIRSLIASDWHIHKTQEQSEKNQIVFTSIDEVIQKYKIMQFARQILFGKPSEYFVRNKPHISSEVSFNEQEVIKNSNKTGRNDPCPCGSGKKYKKCCGK
jgi:hypothetical protein